MRIIRLAAALLITSLVLVAAQEGQGTCSDVLSDTVKQFDNDHTEKLRKLMFDSRKQTDDMERYQSCVNSGNRYVVIVIKSPKIPFNIPLGLCGPQACVAGDYRGALEASRSKLEGALRLVLDLKESNFLEFEISFPQDFTSGKDYTFWFAIFLTSIILLMPFVSCAGNVVHPRRSSISMTQEQLIDQENGGTVKPVQSSTMSKVWQSFDIRSNFRKFLKTEDRDENLRIFHGIRVSSMYWVVWGHIYITRTLLPPQNIEDYAVISKSQFLAVIMGGEFAVDVFLFLSGFFFALIFIKKNDGKALTVFNYFKMLSHRVVRLLPCYIFVLLVYWKLTSLAGSGPLTLVYQSTIDGYCRATWWKDLTFINNLKELAENDCIPWGWYLACDMQIFLIVPILFEFLRRDFSGRKNLLLVLSVISIIYAFVRSLVENWSVLGFSDPKYFAGYYTRPWTRAPAYFIGAYLAIIYLDKKTQDSETSIFGRLRKSIGLQIGSFFVGLLICLAMIFFVAPEISYDNYYSSVSKALYQSLGRPLFVIGQIFIILPCLSGGGKLLNLLLGNKIIEIVGKLTFSMYMIHIMVLSFRTFSEPNPFYLSHKNLFVDSITSLFATMLVALPIHLLVEMPIVNLEHVLIYRKKK